MIKHKIFHKSGPRQSTQPRCRLLYCDITDGADSPLLGLSETARTGDATGELAELISLAMSRYRCSDSPLDDSELRDAWLLADDDRLPELDSGRPL